MTFTRPTQAELRKYLEDRRTQGGPPPTPEEIRRQLGWGMIQPEPHNNDRNPR